MKRLRFDDLEVGQYIITPRLNKVVSAYNSYLGTMSETTQSDGLLPEFIYRVEGIDMPYVMIVPVAHQMSADFNAAPMFVQLEGRDWFVVSTEFVEALLKYQQKKALPVQCPAGWNMDGPTIY